MSLRQGYQRKILSTILLLWMVLFAYRITLYAGERGFFPFDQSIVFDGGYRVYRGQIPFKDFVIPFGPVAFWLQGLVFRLGGVDYGSYLLHAALINVLAAILSWLILKTLFRRTIWLPFVGGLLTGVWFYPPNGTPWPEQTAFFFCLSALLGLLYGLTRREMTSRYKRLLFFGAGMSLWFAFLSKQNAGAFFVPVCILLLTVDLFSPTSPNDSPALGWLAKYLLNLTVLAAGWLTGAIGFALWLFLRSDVANFWHYFFEIPVLKVGSERLPGSVWAWLEAIMLGRTPTVVVILSLASVCVPLLSTLLAHGSEKESPGQRKNRLLAAVLAPGLVLYQNVFTISTNNHPANGVPFVGIIAAIGLGLTLSSSRRRHRSLRIATSGAMLVLMVVAFFVGAKIAASRDVHGIFQKATFPTYMSVEGLSALRWGQPTRIGKAITPDHIERVVAYLDGRGENFFVFPDFTIFYGLLGVPSPQPLVWFHEGLTYPGADHDDPSLDAWIVSDLKENQVRVVVIEQESHFHTERRLEDFPLLQAYLAEHFKLDETIGIFELYVTRQGG